MQTNCLTKWQWKQHNERKEREREKENEKEKEKETGGSGTRVSPRSEIFLPFVHSVILMDMAMTGEYVVI